MQSSDEDDNLWQGWETGASTMEADSLPKEIPVCNGKGVAVLEVGHLKNVDVNSMTDMANGVVAFPDDPTQLVVAELPPLTGRSKKPRRGRVLLVDEDGNGSIKAVPLTDKQDIDIVKAIAGDLYNQAAFLKAMRNAATPKDAVSQIEHEGLREKFTKAGNIIYSADTVAALKPPRKRPPPKKPATAAAGSPAPVAAPPKPKKRKVEEAPPAAPAAPKEAPADSKPPEKKIRVTITADVSTMAEFATLFKS